MRHRFHALCPYFAMFPESFAEEWITRLTKKGEAVVDPFCGRGTAPFQALLLDRLSIGNDVNPVAYCVTRAKTNAPPLSAVRRRLTLLQADFNPRDWGTEAARLPEFFRYAYAPATLRQVLYLRSSLKWNVSDTDALIAAVTLGALHGESHRSPSYLSNRMSRTISTKPRYSVEYWKRNACVPPARDAFALLRSLVTYRYASQPPSRKGTVLHGDMRVLPYALMGSSPMPRLAITSPPYFDITDFEEDQWLRLWFLGGDAKPTHNRVSRDDRLTNIDHYWRMIGDMWRVLGVVLDDKAHVVIRIGGKNLRDRALADGLEGTAALAGRRVTLKSYSVSAIKGRQTDSFRPGARGCLTEVDCHFTIR